MGLLDTFCRFCTRKLDDTRSANIFSAENAPLLETALKCIALPMTENDCYPNYTCNLCAHRLNDTAEFHKRGLSAVSAFDKFLSKNGDAPPDSLHNFLMAVKFEEPLLNELFEETECDVVDECWWKQEILSDQEKEAEASFAEREHCIVADGKSYELKDCSVELTRCDIISVGPTPATQTGNVLPSAVEKSSAIQCTSSTDNNRGTSSMKRENLFACKFCKKSFKWKCRLTRHILTHTGEKPYTCERCGQRFSQRSSSLRHQRLHKGEEVNKCEQCGRNFHDPASLASHKILLDCQRKSYGCEHCSKRFSRKSLLVTHMSSHMREKPFICEDCGSRFTLYTNYHRHKGLHTGEKRYKCDQCGKCFALRSYLAAHMPIHCRETQYKCENCSKSFTSRKYLLLHKRIHNIERPFTCEDCGRSYNVKRSFVRHRSLHTGERPYKCEQCGKSFIDPSSLAVHKIRYNAERQFICKLCGHSYKRRVDFVRHLKIHGKL